VIRRINSVFLTSVCGRLLVALNQILLVPLFLHSWGSVRYGEWVSLTALCSYLSVMEIGVPAYLANRLHMDFKSAKTEHFVRDFQSALLLNIILICLGICILSSLILFLSIESLFNLHDISESSGSMILALVGLSVLFAIPAAMMTGVYRAHLDHPLYFKIRNIVLLLQLCFLAASLSMCAGVIVVSFLLLCFQVGQSILFLVDANRRYPEIKLGLSNGNLKTIRSFLKPSGYFFLIQISSAVVIQSPILIIGHFWGGAAVVAFSTTRIMVGSVKQVFDSIRAAIWPEITRMFCNNDFTNLLKLHRMAIKFGVGAALVFSAGLFFSGPSIYSAWIGKAVPLNKALFYVLLIYLFLQSPWYITSAFQAAVNRHKALSCIHGIMAGVNLIACMLLVPQWGILGAGLALLVSDVLIASAAIPYFSTKLLGQSLRDFWLIAIVNGIPTLTVLLLTGWLLTPIFSTTSLISAIVLATVVMSAGVAAFFFTWLSTPERRWSIEQVKRYRFLRKA